MQNAMQRCYRPRAINASFPSPVLRTMWSQFSLKTLRSLGGGDGDYVYNYFCRRQTKNNFYISSEEGQTPVGYQHQCAKVTNLKSALKNEQQLWEWGREMEGPGNEGDTHVEAQTTDTGWLLVACPAQCQLSLSPSCFFDPSLNCPRYFIGFHEFPLLTLS